jgi:hypothetical protein
MQNRSVPELKTDGDPWLARIHARFDRLGALITEQGVDMRRRIDVFAEQFKADLWRTVERRHTRIENHERGFQSPEKRRR